MVVISVKLHTKADKGVRAKKVNESGQDGVVVLCRIWPMQTVYYSKRDSVVGKSFSKVGKMVSLCRIWTMQTVY